MKAGKLLEFKKNKFKLTQEQGQLLKKIENKLDAMFKDLNIDVEFTRHFKERFIQRNILPDELIDTFKKLHSKHKTKIVKDEYEVLIKDVFNYLNIPVVIEWDEKDKEYELRNITIFRDKSDIPHQTKEIIKV